MKEARTKHHIFCNYFSTDPTTCKFCERLEEEYPMENMTPDELLKKYFPDAIPIPRDDNEKRNDS